MNLNSRGIITRSSSFDLPNLLNNNGLSLKFVVILRPLKVNSHILPHFKGLVSGFEASIEQRHGGN